MLNALPTPSTATGLQSNLLPSLAAEAPGQRAAIEARQGFAALMQQQADLRSADLKTADLKLAEASASRARADESRPPAAAPTRSTAVADDTRAPRQEPAKAAATPAASRPAKTSEGSAGKPADRAERTKTTRPEGSSPPAKEVHDETTAASDKTAAAAAVAAGAAPGPADAPAALTEGAADLALAAAVAASRRPPSPLPGGREQGNSGRPDAAAFDDQPIPRLPRTTATEATAAAARLAAALSPKLTADALEPMAQDAQAADANAKDPAEAGASTLNPEPASLQPWLQAQAMVTHWRPVGDDTTPTTEADPPGLQVQATDAPDAAAPLADEPALQARRPALVAPPDLRAAGGAAPALATPATDAPADPITDGALISTAPTPQDAARAWADEARHANPARTTDVPGIGQRGRWRPEPEQADADRATPQRPDATGPGLQAPAHTDASALPSPTLANQPAPAVPTSPLPVATDQRPDPATAPTPATAAQLALANAAGAPARGLNDPATPGARSAGERPLTGRAERAAERATVMQDTSRPDGPRAIGAESLSAAHQPVDAVAERPSPSQVVDARSDAASAANAKVPEAALANGGLPNRAAEGALPAQAGVQAPTARTEAPGRLELSRAEAPPAATANAPAPGSLPQAQVGAPATPATNAFAPLLTAAAAPPPAEARIAVPLNSPEFAPALGAQISVFTRDGVQTARLQLNPAEMGPITVQIALDGSAARVDFQADVAATRDVIEASLPALAGALQDAGLTLAGGGVFQHAPGQQQQPEGQASQPGRGAGHADSTRTGQLAEPATPVVTARRGLVDLVA